MVSQTLATTRRGPSEGADMLCGSRATQSESDAHWRRIAAVLAASDGTVSLDDLLDTLPNGPGSNPDDLPSDSGTVRDVRKALERLRNADLSKSVKGSRIESHFPYAQHDAGVILVAPHGLRDDAGLDQSAATEDDTLSYTSSRPVALKCHTNSVVAHTESFARTLRLSSKIAADVSLAAFLHDAGKARRPVFRPCWPEATGGIVQMVLQLPRAEGSHQRGRG